ncbi:MAG: hypothetical protein NC336_00125 [Clostridium sp.]|nr:hypothetical protein [Clostridium sp.]
MNNNKLAAVSLLITFLPTLAATHSFTEGRYQVTYDDTAKEFTVSCDGTEFLKKAYSEVTYNILGESADRTISSRQIAATAATEQVDDCFGRGVSHQFVFTDGTATMRQYFNFYSDTHFICYNTVESNDGETILQSRYLVPLAATETYSTPFPSNSSVRMIWVPFDNDGHGRYHNYSFSAMNESDSWSHEVSAAFDPDSRRGLVAGSVDHDKWKSGIQLYGRYGSRLYKFVLQSGFTNETTRDALPHGKVKGQTVSSARYMVGMFDDWREGLNTFGDCCTASTPRPGWKAGNPVGWSTYGVQQERVNEDGVRDCLDFINDNFRDAGFYDSEDLVSVSFDACANDNISDYKIQQLIKNKLTPENMVLGMYGGHLCVWPWALDSKIDGTGVGPNPDYVGRNIALRVNGEIYPMPCNGAVAVDPTHPAVRLNLEKFMKKWAGWGVKYIKMDFLNCGIIEGDKWYDPEITTGVMAYNYGMKMMYDLAEQYGIYIVEAMSPLFPYNYAHGRRTCCDRFSKIDETEYVMNAISYGWWTDRLYTVNDPDQLVLVGRNNKKSETIGENRARATSGMVTGAYIWGDNFSDRCVHTSAEEASKQGVSVGDPVGWVDESKQRALEIMSNAEVNRYVRTHTGSFQPVEGGDPTTILNGSNQQSERLFYRYLPEERCCYVAAFCFSKYSNYSASLTWERLGIVGEQITGIREIWLGEDIDFDDNGFKVSVPKADARVYRIDFYRDPTGIAGTVRDNSTVSVTANDGIVCVKAGTGISGVRIFDLTGRQIAAAEVDGRLAADIPTGSVAGPVIVSVALTDNTLETTKLIIK